MSKKGILLVSSKKNKSLPEFIEENFKTDGFDVTIKKSIEKSKRGIPKCPGTFLCSPFFNEIIKNSLPSLIIIEADREWMNNMKDIGGKNNHDKCIIITSEELIKSNINWIKGISQESEEPSDSKECQNIEDFVEKKLKSFVKKMKDCKGQNIYSMLIKEFEKPLITFILKETKGNKTQAAHLLGINRNTLTKKIKELNLLIK